MQDPTKAEGGKETDTAPFMSWLSSERTLEQGLVDTLADIIKDQLYVNPLEYLEADHGFEVLFMPLSCLLLCNVGRLRDR